MRVIYVNSSLDQVLFKPDGVSIIVWKITLASVCLAIAMFTTLGNLLTLIAALRMKQFHNSVSNLYIASLAGADLVVGALVMNFRILYTVVYELEWVFGEWLCYIWQILDFACCSISLYSICAIAFDRWFNLQKPLRIFKRSRKFARKTILVIWVMPVLVSVTAFFTIGEPMLDSKQCCYSWEYITLVPLFAIPVFYIPVLLLVIMFVRIAYVIRNHMYFLQTHSNRKPSKRIEPDLSTAISNSPLPKKREGIPIQHKRSSPVIILSSEVRCQNILNDWLSDPLTMKIDQNLSGDSAGPSTIMCHEACLEPKSDLSGSVGRSTRGIDKTLLASSVSSDASHNVCDCKTTGAPLPKLPMYRSKRTISRQLAVTSPQRVAECQTTSLIFHQTQTTARQLHRSQTETALLQKSSGLRSNDVVPCFVQGAHIARKISSNLFSELIPNATNNLAQQVRAARAVGLIMVCFLLCWLPFIVIWPIKVLRPACISDRLYNLAIWANYLNSTINPILYALCSPRFQLAIRHYFFGNRSKTATSLGRSVHLTNAYGT